MSMNFNRLSTDDKILIMEGAQVLGDVVAGEGTAFWYNSVCRGEMQSVRIGKRCNIQDLALIHNKVTIGDDVSVGHCATVHGATIGDRVIVGMGATVLDGAVIGNDCIIGGRSCHGQDERARRFDDPRLPGQGRARADGEGKGEHSGQRRALS